MFSGTLCHRAPSEVVGLIYRVSEPAELRRRRAKMNGAQHGKDQEKSEGSVAEHVVGNGCHKGEEKGGQYV
jgi:hypothetical protein